MIARQIFMALTMFFDITPVIGNILDPCWRTAFRFIAVVD